MSNLMALGSKLLSYCSILCDYGSSHGEHVERLTFLLLLKMADEQSQLSGTPSAIPKGKDWPSLLAKDGDELEELGTIFRKAQNKIQNPAKLRRLIRYLAVA